MIYFTKVPYRQLLFFVLIHSASLALSASVLASATTNFTQTINAGTLAIDIVDTTSGYSSVASPSVAMAAVTFSFSCQQTTGTLGTTTEAIYMKNPDAADAGWTASIAASAPTAVWDGAASDFDFNDPGGSGCTDDTDTDSVGGQMTINPNAGTLAAGQCSSCGVTGVTKGTSTAFNEGTTDSVTLVTAAANSDDIGDWKLTGVAVSQWIPAEQPAASDYDISMTVTII